MPVAANLIPEFLRPVLPIDQDHFRQLYRRSGPLSCEYSFGNLLAWGGIYHGHWGEFRGATVIYLQQSDDLLFPIGADLTATDLAELSAAFRARGHAGAYHQVPLAWIARTPDLERHFQAVPNPDYADYLHLVPRLVELNGTKLNKKRNLIRQFERTCPGTVPRTLGPEHAQACLDLTRHWATGRQAWTIEREDEAIAAAFHHFTAGGFEGVGLFADDHLLAFCLFSLMGDVAVVHFEKAIPELKGAAQAINRETARALLGRCRYLNREQDLGLPGLRQAKRSYDPDLILVNADLHPFPKVVTTLNP